jgi:hypothetical protein
MWKIFTENTLVHPDGSFVPTDEGNRHYQEYLAWVAEGNIAEEWNPEETE